MTAFFKSLASKKLIVSGAGVAFLQTLPMTDNLRASLTTGIFLIYVVAQAYVDSKKV